MVEGDTWKDALAELVVDPLSGEDFLQSLMAKWGMQGMERS